MMSAYAQFTTTGVPRQRTERAAQSIKFETRPPATSKDPMFIGRDDGLQGLLTNAVPKARLSYSEPFMTLVDAKADPLFVAAAVPLPAAGVAHPGPGNYEEHVLARAFHRHNRFMAERFEPRTAVGAPPADAGVNALATGLIFRYGQNPVLHAGDNGYEDQTSAGAGGNINTALRTYDELDVALAARAAAGDPRCYLGFPGIAEHMALCLHRAADIDMNGQRAGRDRTAVVDPTAAMTSTSIDSARPLRGFDSGPWQDQGGVNYSHTRGQLSLRQWQDWTILQIAHMERVEMGDGRNANGSLAMNVRVNAGAAPQGELDVGGMWCKASNHRKRNVLMALLYSRTDDELHAQTLFGRDHTRNTPTCKEVEVSVKYDTRCDHTLVGANNTYTYLDNGIVRANMPGEAIFMNSTEDGDAASIVREIDIALSTRFMRAGKTLFVIGKEVVLPLLEYDGKHVVDLRPDTVVPGLYMKGHDELTGAELVEQVPTIQLYEAPDITAAVRPQLNNVLRYRRLAGEPESLDAALLRTQGRESIIDSVPAVPDNCTGVHGTNARTGGTAAFRARYPLQFPVWSSDPRLGDQGLPLAGDGTPGSIDQIVARYSYHIRPEFARRSFTGMKLPIAINDGPLLPQPPLPIGTAAERRTYFSACATAGYGQYGLPGPSQTNFKGGCHAVVAPVDVLNRISGIQTIRNPRTQIPTATDLASAMSRRGRHNEVGVAMQSLQSGRQGDIMLHDGV